MPPTEAAAARVPTSARAQDRSGGASPSTDARLVTLPRAGRHKTLRWQWDAVDITTRKMLALIPVAIHDSNLTDDLSSRCDNLHAFYATYIA